MAVQSTRRSLLVQGTSVAALALTPGMGWTQPRPLAEAVLATPGPGSAVSFIPELAVKIGADRAEGVALRLKFVSGGGVAIREIGDDNAQFGVFGLPAAMQANLSAPRFVALAAIENRALLSLMVRSDLKGVVRRVEDLRGRVLGIHSNSLSTLTTGQQFLLLVLREHGIRPDEVRFVAAGQSWETESSALQSRTADAIVTEEPFGLRLSLEGLAYPLLRIGHVDDPGTLPGEKFLRGTLIAKRSLVAAQPRLAESLVRVMQRTLAWRKTHTASEVIEALGLAGPEARPFLTMLQQYPQQFSDDGKFSEVQLAQTEEFFRKSAGDASDAVAYRLESMLVDRWAGRKP